MKILSRVVMLIALSNLLPGPATAQSSLRSELLKGVSADPSEVDLHFWYAGDDDVEGATQLKSFLEFNGLEVKKTSGNLLAVVRKETLIAIQTSTNARGLDRLVAVIALNLKAEADEETLAAIVSKLTERFPGVQFSVKSSALLCQSQITFVDRLSLEELEAALDYMVGLQFASVIVAPELIGLLKR